MLAALVSGLLVAILVAVFALQNGEPVVVRLFSAQLHVSLGLALVLAAAGGALAALLLCLAAAIKKGVAAALLRRRNAAQRPPL